MDYTYRCSAGHEFKVEQRMSDPRIEKCECGEDCKQQITRVPAIKVRRTIQGSGHEYRADLAEFPGDRRAFVDGPRAVSRRVDQLKREGAFVGKASDMAPGVSGTNRPAVPMPSISEVYKEVRQQLGEG